MTTSQIVGFALIGAEIVLLLLYGTYKLGKAHGLREARKAFEAPLRGPRS